MPASPPGTMLVKSSAGCATSEPFWMTRKRPGCSVKNIRPSGANTISHGTCRPEAITSVLSATAPGVGEGVGVGVGLGVGDGLGVGVGDGVGVADGDGLGVGLGDGLAAGGVV